MKPLLILMRIVFVGIFWSIFFLEGIRVIMLTNWRFDILRPTHWNHALNLWLNGWIIDDPKEWAFVLIIITFIPLWLTGWAALSMIKMSNIFGWTILIPFRIFNKIFEKPVKIITNTASVKVVKKKKSYKEVRPQSIRMPMESSSYNLPNQKSTLRSPATNHIQPSAPLSKNTENKPTAAFDHSLFQFDDNEASEFDFDLFDEKSKEETTKPIEAPVADNAQPKNRNKNKNKNKSTPIPDSAPKSAETTPRQNQNSNSNSTLEVLKQKGYEVITGTTIRNTLIDFIGISNNQICLCINDKEPGDWLADEERFNDEEPLWFSESSHRISPVRKIDIARLILSEKLADADLKFDIDAYIIEQIGNIINAEDMFEIWEGMKIEVTRIDRGTPKELKLFAKAIEEANGKIDNEKFEKVKKIIRSIA